MHAFRVLLFCLLCICLTAMYHFTQCAQFGSGDSNSRSELVRRLPSGEVDWDSGFIYAVGESVVPPADVEPDRAKAYPKARSYAKMKAITNLLNTLDAIPVTFKTNCRDHISRDAALRQSIENCVSNAEVVDERQKRQGSDTIVVLTVRAALYGPAGLGTAVLKSRFSAPPEGTVGVNVDKKGEARGSTIEPSAKGPFTGLIVDCSGLKVDTALSPKIRRTDGSELYGTPPTGSGSTFSRGIVAYARNVEQARRKDRAGATPMVIRAVGRAGARHMCDVIVSDSDAQRIVSENLINHFLDRLDVIFVVD